MYKLWFQHFQKQLCYFFCFYIFNMSRLKEEERIRVCTLLDEKLYSPTEFSKQYNVDISTCGRENCLLFLSLYFEHPGLSQVQDFSGP